MSQKQKRFWEIDALRGIAIISMIGYHIYFDTYFLNIFELDYYQAPFIGAMFIFLVGVSLTLSYSRVENTLKSYQITLKFIKRGLFIFGLGLVITFFTWIFVPDAFIVFGVLHCIGISIIISYPFIRGKIINIVLGSILILIGVWLYTAFTWNFSWFFWLGFIPSRFYTLDYFPLLPWFGVVLIGISIGNILYPHGKALFSLPDLSQKRLVKLLSYLGRHSLIIYFIHQPIILGILFAIKSMQ